MHRYDWHHVDPDLGIRPGVNAADVANTESLEPYDEVMSLAAYLAQWQFVHCPHNAKPTLTLECIRAAQAVLPMLHREDPEIERERRQVERDRREGVAV